MSFTVGYCFIHDSQRFNIKRHYISLLLLTSTSKSHGIVFIWIIRSLKSIPKALYLLSTNVHRHRLPNMASEMSWSPNYCLNCDKQTVEPHYCSQICRLEDLEKSALSISNNTHHSSSYTSSTFSTTVPARSIQLPPAFNFAAYRQGNLSTSYSPPSSPRSSATAQQLQSAARYYTTPSAPSIYRSVSEYPSRKRSLNTSTSRSSLSSMASTSTNGLSDEAISELQKYSNAFDHMRDYKRRVTLS